MEDEKHPLDGLKLMAEEIAVAFNPEPSRRPTWAPRLQPTDEMTTLLCELKLLSAEDKPVIRLWADFTNPRRGKVHCKGFQLCAGTERGKKIWIAQYHDKQAVIASLQQKIERTPYLEIHDKYQQALRSTEQKRGGWSFGPCWVSSAQSRNRLRELGSQRVADFCEAPEKQMQAAGKFYGHCCICGRALTDPISREYGIGPECRRGRDVRTFPGQWIIGGTNAENQSYETLKV